MPKKKRGSSFTKIKGKAKCKKMDKTDPIASTNRFAKKSTSQTETSTTSTGSANIASAAAASLAASTRSAHTKRQAAIAVKDKLKMNMMENFNPDTSNREKKKLEKKLATTKKTSGQVNDANGIHIQSGVDMCDCLDLLCPGCFFPCKKCKNTKCGPECRVNRKIRYESIEYHGFNYVRKNPLEK